MQRIGEVAGVVYVDDSKATNPESVEPALGAFDCIHWILGGRAKSDDLDACAPYFDRVARAYTIGEAGPGFAAVLRPPIERKGDASGKNGSGRVSHGGCCVHKKKT